MRQNVAQSGASTHTAITGSSPSLSALDGVTLNNILVATFAHGNASEPLSEFTATVDWGDDNTSSPVVATGGGVCLILEALELPAVQGRGERQDFQGHAAAERNLHRLVHDSHTAAADLPH
jgi:hypothetical protein